MQVIYRADDGREFEDAFECEHYEWKLKHPNIQNILAYDKDGKRLSNLYSEETYSKTEKLVIPSCAALRDLRALGKYTGFSCYEWIDNPGIWVFENDRFVPTKTA